jgi:8-oxo-dGTP diphosphatase
MIDGSGGIDGSGRSGGGSGMQQRRRIAAYGLCRDGELFLLARRSARCDFPGIWQVPGGGLRHAEHPADAVVRQLAAETGIDVALGGVRTVLADVIRLGDVAVHTDRVVYDVAVRPGRLRSGADGTIDRVAWLSLAEASRVRLMPFTAELLGLPVVPLSEETLGAWSEAKQAQQGEREEGKVSAASRGPIKPPTDRRQRFGAYGLVTDPADRILLTQIAPGYPGAGNWHLPGGGTDHGEQPASGLLRELVEESGQLGRVTGLLSVDNLHNPAALGPEGRPLDWHGVRVIYRVEVAAPTEPEVTELAGGSTARAAWFVRQDVAGLRLSDLAATALGMPHRRRR